MSSVMWTC
ncbi:hypothetical protein EYF80_059776 [Liparis tanakae]|uniref:Uncharacterized protein n=1 Tax=Liparis tanakae TaxID=230148 RepID=A0A4Z2ENP0_9TELE|nr:hypothetical protein EYF80_059776 [Liparis tanakae]